MKPDHVKNAAVAVVVIAAAAAAIAAAAVVVIAAAAVAIAAAAVVVIAAAAIHATRVVAVGGMIITVAVMTLAVAIAGKLLRWKCNLLLPK